MELVDSGPNVELRGEDEIIFAQAPDAMRGKIQHHLSPGQKNIRMMTFLLGHLSDAIREIQGADPKYLVSVVMNGSWLQRIRSEQLIFTWANEYTAQNYAVAGFVNMVASGQTDYYFANIPQSVPRLGNYILIYERKS